MCVFNKRATCRKWASARPCWRPREEQTRERGPEKTIGFPPPRRPVPRAALLRASRSSRSRRSSAQEGTGQEAPTGGTGASAGRRGLALIKTKNAPFPSSGPCPNSHARQPPHMTDSRVTPTSTSPAPLSTSAINVERWPVRRAGLRQVQRRQKLLGARPRQRKSRSNQSRSVCDSSAALTGHRSGCEPSIAVAQMTLTLSALRQ